MRSRRIFSARSGSCSRGSAFRSAGEWIVGKGPDLGALEESDVIGLGVSLGAAGLGGLA